MALFDRLGDIARNIGDKANSAIEITKLNSKLSSEKSEISNCLIQIGEFYYKKYQAGDPTDSGVSELFQAIDNHNKIIEDTQAEIARIQAENFSQEQTTPDKQAASEAPTNIAATQIEPDPKTDMGSSAETTKRVCPKCGAQVAEGRNFCSECGNKME